jgi:serine/threonine protein kinase
MENIASGICYLHQNGIVHADIKPVSVQITLHTACADLQGDQHNILIREQNGVYSAVIADFGIATVGDDVGSDCRPKANDSQASRERLPVWGILGQPLIPDVFSDIWGWGVMCVWVRHRHLTFSSSLILIR